MGEGPVLYTFETSLFTMFIAEDEGTFVNSRLGCSNVLLVHGVIRGFSSTLKNFIIDFLSTSFTSHVVIIKGAYYIGNISDLKLVNGRFFSKFANVRTLQSFPLYSINIRSACI